MQHLTQNKFEKFTQKLKKICCKDNMLFKRNFSCCPTCGHSEIHTMQVNHLTYKDYDAYLFYTQSDTNRIYETLKDSVKVTFYVSWGLFQDKSVIPQDFKGLMEYITQITQKRQNMQNCIGNVQYGLRKDFEECNRTQPQEAYMKIFERFTKHIISCSAYYTDCTVDFIDFKKPLRVTITL